MRNRECDGDDNDFVDGFWVAPVLSRKFGHEYVVRSWSGGSRRRTMTDCSFTDSRDELTMSRTNLPHIRAACSEEATDLSREVE